MRLLLTKRTRLDVLDVAFGRWFWGWSLTHHQACMESLQIFVDMI